MLLSYLLRQYIYVHCLRTGMFIKNYANVGKATKKKVNKTGPFRETYRFIRE